MKNNLVALLLFGLWSVAAASPTPRLRWCCISTAELRKCNDLRSRHKEFIFDCVKKESVDLCVNAIRNNRADIIDLDGGDIYAYRNDLYVAASENYGFGATSYYSVAIVRNEEGRPMDIKSLRGRKTCHTGVGKSSGWIVPMGKMMRMNLDPLRSFDSSCAPGANDQYYQEKFFGGYYDPKWCKNCHGDFEHLHKCDRDHDEIYYSYKGALRCLDDRAGDVAFIKQSVIKEKDYDKYKLLCMDGSVRDHEDWEHCNLGRIPAHAVMMSRNLNSVAAASILDSLNTVLQKDPAGFYAEFDGNDDLLWKSKTQSFIAVDSPFPIDHIGQDYKCNFDAVTMQPADNSCEDLSNL